MEKQFAHFERHRCSAASARCASRSRSADRPSVRRGRNALRASVRLADTPLRRSRRSRCGWYRRRRVPSSPSSLTSLRADVVTAGPFTKSVDPYVRGRDVADALATWNRSSFGRHGEILATTERRASRGVAVPPRSARLLDVAGPRQIELYLPAALKSPTKRSLNDAVSCKASPGALGCSNRKRSPKDDRADPGSD